MALHTGHRARVKEKFRNDGFDNFADHEVLEALLFYPIPYRDTNPTAHELIDLAGGFSKVFTLTEEAVSSVSYCGNHTALFLHLVDEIARRSIGTQNDLCDYATEEARRTLALHTVEGVTDEATYILLFDNHYSLLGTKRIFTGSYASSAFRPGMVVSEVLLARASMVVLVTNHDTCVARPSPYEVEATTNILRALELLDIHLLDHYIVGGPVATSVLQLMQTKAKEIRRQNSTPLFRMVKKEEEETT